MPSLPQQEHFSYTLPSLIELSHNEINSHLAAWLNRPSQADISLINQNTPNEIKDSSHPTPKKLEEQCDLADSKYNSNYPREIKENIESNITLLDCTCGNGYDTVFMIETVLKLKPNKNFTILSFDIQEPALLNAKRLIMQARPEYADVANKNHSNDELQLQSREKIAPTPFSHKIDENLEKESSTEYGQAIPNGQTSENSFLSSSSSNSKNSSSSSSNSKNSSSENSSSSSSNSKNSISNSSSSSSSISSSSNSKNSNNNSQSSENTEYNLPAVELNISSSANLSFSLIANKSQVHLINTGHEEMEKYIKEGQALPLAMFNLGYLPGSDKKVTTQIETTLAAIKYLEENMSEQALISIHAYGGHNDNDELLRVSQYMEQLDPKKWKVASYQLCNKTKNKEVLFLAQKTPLYRY